MGTVKQVSDRISIKSEDESVETKRERPSVWSGKRPSEEGWLQEHKQQLPAFIPGFSSPRALSPLCKAPESNTSAVMLL